MNHFKTSVCFLVLVNVLKMHSLNSCSDFVFLLSFAVYAADRYIHFILVAISIHNNEAPRFGRKQLLKSAQVISIKDSRLIKQKI